GEERVPVVVVVERAPRLPVGLRVVEQVPLVLGNGDARAVLPDARSSPALIPVMVRVEDPFDPLDACPSHRVEHGARARVDEQAALAVCQEIDVAGIPNAVEMRAELLEPGPSPA